jgi:hypothetical protein
MVHNRVYCHLRFAAPNIYKASTKEESMTDADNEESGNGLWHKRFNSWSIMALGKKYQSLMQ